MCISMVNWSDYVVNHPRINHPGGRRAHLCNVKLQMVYPLAIVPLLVAIAQPVPMLDITTQPSSQPLNRTPLVHVSR